MATVYTDLNDLFSLIALPPTWFVVLLDGFMLTFNESVELGCFPPFRQLLNHRVTPRL